MRHYSPNETSKLMRAALYTAFPNTRFTVRLSKYSGGHSIDAHWMDGPTDEQTKCIIDRFSSRGFDGMTDMSYSCGKRMYKGEHVSMGGGYTNGSRSVSRALLFAVADRVAYECGVEAPEVRENGDVKNNYAYLAGPDGFHNVHVPFAWYPHYIDSDKEHEERRKFLTMDDITAPGHLLAHDSHEGEYLTRLIDRIAHHVSMEPIAQRVELPEYIRDEEAA